jgi:hypothetical protein
LETLLASKKLPSSFFSLFSSFQRGSENRRKYAKTNVRTMTNIGKTADDLGPLATTLLVIVVTVAVGAVMLGQFKDTSYLEQSITNETFNATSDPFIYEVSDASNSDFVELESAQAYSSTSQNTKVTTTLVNSTHVNVSGVSLDSTDESLDYTYSYETTGTNVVRQGLDALSTFGDFLPVIVIVGIGAVILAMMRVFGSGRKTAA